MSIVRLSADDIRCESSMSRRNYNKEFVIAPLLQRLDWLEDGWASSRSWPRLSEERSKVEGEIAQAQIIIKQIEDEIRQLGRDADLALLRYI